MENGGSGYFPMRVVRPLLAARRLHYGFWLPNTYYVKSNAGLTNLRQGIDYLEKSLARYDVLLVAIALPSALLPT